jgi:hypothetical protein
MKRRPFSFGETGHTKDGLGYLKVAFERIQAECDVLEDKIDAMTGVIFKKHKYSAEVLSAQLRRIESCAGKIKDDVDRWEAARRLSFRLRLLYNEQAELTHGRLREIIGQIKRRVPTFWESVCEVFTRVYRLIVETLLPLIGGNFFLLFRKHKALKEQ